VGGGVQAATADEESRTLRTLAFATTEELIHATLEFALGSNVRSQDAAGVRSAVATMQCIQHAWESPRRPY